MPTGRANGLLASSQAISLSNFRTGAKNRCQKWAVPILDAPDGRRDDFLDPYFKHAKNDAVLVILKAREPARIMMAIGKDASFCHLTKAKTMITHRSLSTNPPIRLCEGNG